MTAFRYARTAAILGPSVFDHAPGTISLASGAAYPPLLPDLLAEAAEAVGPFREEAMQYGPLMGLDDLRAAVCAHVAADGIDARPENVLITYGAKSALDLAARVFLEPGDRVIVTRPSYMTAVHILRTHQASFLEIGQDAEGPRVDELDSRLRRLAANAEPMPKLMFDVPDFHNPTGITTSLARREALLELARRHDFVLCEDDPYRRIRFAGEAVPPLRSLDRSGHVLALGTVSKVLAPGLRVGWALGDPGIVRRMALQKADGGSNTFAQRMVVQLMQSRRLQAHVSVLRRQMRRHRDVLVAALAEHLPAARIRVPEGGYFLWAELPPGDDAERVVALGIDEGVEATPGRLAFAGDDPGHCLRLAYSPVDEAGLRDAAARLGRAWRRYRASAP